MKNCVIENGILKAYSGKDAVVVVPDGVTCIGGDLLPVDKNRGVEGALDGYKAFYCNKKLEELYLPDTVEEIGFKALESCESLRVLGFSDKMKKFGCNAINGCDALKTIIYRGTVYEFSCLEMPGQTPDLEVVYCVDGQIRFGKDREFYIDTMYFPGTRTEWDNRYGADNWRNKRCKKIICADEM